MDSTLKARLYSAGFGALTGIRSMSGLALIGRGLREGSRPAGRIGRADRVLTSKVTVTLLTALAAGEVVADKLPFMPSRTDAAPLFGRAVLGALVGSLAGAYYGDSRIVGACVGGLSAVGSAFLFTRLRKRLDAQTGLPDWAMGGLEDAVVISGGRVLWNGLTA